MASDVGALDCEAISGEAQKEQSFLRVVVKSAIGDSVRVFAPLISRILFVQMLPSLAHSVSNCSVRLSSVQV